MKSFTYSGIQKRVSKAVSEKFPDISYAYMRKLLRKADVKINGKRTREDAPVQNGDTVTVYDSVCPPAVFSPKIVYEDENIAAFVKPAGIASEGEDSFEEKVRENFSSDYILCHRLDTNTEGILLFAKKETVFEELKRQFKAGNIEKHYLALVFGKVSAPAVFTDYLVKDAGASRVYVYSAPRENSQKIITQITPVALRGETTLLDVTLVTGRTHQIRAHLAYRGYPLIGDGKYGKEEINRRYGAKIQKLLAYKLIFRISEGDLAYLNGKELLIDTSNF